MNNIGILESSRIYASGGGEDYPTTDLLARWTFDDSDLTDSYGSWDMSGSPSAYPTGIIEKGMTCNTGVKVGKTGDYSSSLLGTNSLTFAMWIYIGMWHELSWKTFTYDGPNSNPYTRLGLNLYNPTSGQLNMTFFRYGTTSMSGGGVSATSNTFAFTQNSWQHIAVTYANGDDYDENLTFYLNAVSKGYTAPAGWQTYGNTTLANGNAAGFNFGGSNQVTNPRTIGFDQVYIYNRALTSTEIATLYNSGSGI